jgi:hypothetical protein
MSDESPDPARDEPGGYGPTWEPFDWADMRRLARYVSPRALRGLRLTTDIGALAGEADRASANTATATALFDALVRHDISYALEPWTGLTTQQIRHPRWLVEDKWGTCLDIAVTYAAMCLDAHLAPLLAITDRHALVLLQPGRAVGYSALPPLSLPWTRTRSGESAGSVVEIADGDAARRDAAAGNLLAVDVVGATTTYASTFEDAILAGAEYLEPGTLLVDVVSLHLHNDCRPLPPPSERPSIRTYLPGSQRRFERYADHSGILEHLEGCEGIVALVAPQGQGKSTLARQLVLDAPFGAAWFLNASERRTLIGSLAAADRAESNETAAGRASQERVGFSANALMRLSEAEGRWIVIYDNADGDPGEIMPLLARPHDGQLVVITTTNPEWERVSEVRALRLPPLSAHTVATALGGVDLVDLVAGRALLLHAFRAFLSWSGETPARVAEHAPQDLPIDDPRRGPATLWAATRGRLPPDAETFCLQLAYLPADQQPIALLEALSPTARELTRDLTAAGLLTQEAGFVRLHRLFGAAVRSDISERDPVIHTEAVIGLTNRLEAYKILDNFADRDTLFRLDDALCEIDEHAPEPDERLGIALHAIAELLEPAGHTRRSGDTYARSVRHLERRRDLLAGALHGRARTVNQHHANDEALLRQAVTWATQAREILLALPKHEGEADRCLAMQGLLRQKLAKFPLNGESTLQLLRDALVVIQEAHELRVDRLDPMDPELARSEFNLAGIRIDLAKLEHGLARDHLAAADAVYTSVAARRERIYGRSVHPHIAACIIGRGYVAYYRAVLLSAAPPTKTAWLRSASAFASEALGQREALEGSLDGDETRKVLRFLAKVALARRVTAIRPERELKSVFSEVSRELEFAAVPTLPSNTRDIEAAIKEWVYSSALAAVVGAFGGGAPEQGTDLGDTLRWLEDFSLCWDYRSGAERNLVAEQELDADTTTLVVRAAAALGLVGTSEPPAKRYDHVLVLGGLVRACIARPIYAARLIDTGKVHAQDVTALGGFRELKGNEHELAATLGYTGLVDEYHAMDAGVRSAFAVEEPFAERGEQSDIVGASWAVREYHLADGGAIRVVGAPSSEPGVRRANTPDTYAWYASELAKLHSGERVLIVTSDIYLPFQHADALRMLALPYSVEVDAVGVSPGDAHPSLAQRFEAHNYLQEFRSTIRAFRALHSALHAD